MRVQAVHTGQLVGRRTVEAAGKGFLLSRRVGERIALNHAVKMNGRTGQFGRIRTTLGAAARIADVDTDGFAVEVHAGFHFSGAAADVQILRIGRASTP